MKIAVTLGDPRGIGPEVAEAALADREVAGAASFVRVGPDPLLRASGDVGIGPHLGLVAHAGIAVDDRPFFDFDVAWSRLASSI